VERVGVRLEKAGGEVILNEENKTRHYIVPVTFRSKKG